MACDIGVDIGGTNIKLGLVDAHGRVTHRLTLATQARRGPGPALERLGRRINELAEVRRVRSVGVGIAGLVDHVRGVVRLPPNLPGWHGTPVKTILEDLTGLPVAVANDVNAVTLGEWLFGRGKGCRNLFCLTLGTGVGGGIVADNRLLLGANHAAGELGHTVICAEGAACACGGRGCLEAYVSSRAIIERARRLLRRQLRRLAGHRNQLRMFPGHAEDPSSIFALVKDRLAAVTPREIGIAARAGDRLALEVVEETAGYLSIGISNLVALFDPELVIIGGGVSRIGRPLLRAVRRQVMARIPLFSGRRFEVVLSKLGTNSGILGASRLARHLNA
uniref:ROK family protein n=1 Tax=candidate division WOR-3 bacterium TaxID=2052148 RepID=A0A7C4CEW9_UNCW3